MEEKYCLSGRRTTISKSQLNLKKIDALQMLKLTPKLNEPMHINKAGSVFCIVVRGWADAFCEGRIYKPGQNEGILFEKGERHRIVKGKGLMLSISSEDYSKKLRTIHEK